MARAARSLQHLCRAAFSVCDAVSTSAAPAPTLAQLGVGTLWGAAAPAGGSLPGAAASFSGLRQLARHFHASPGLWAAEQGGPTINPLQQAPVPAPGGAGAAASPLGPALTLAGGDVSDTSRAVARGLAISPQKLNDFAKVVRGLSLADAFYQCDISPKKSAKLVRKALQSAAANAVNNQGLDAARLRVGEAWVGRGVHLKRVSLHGRGRSAQRLRYRSHLTVVLREEEEQPRVRTRVLPMLAERPRFKRLPPAEKSR